jgi:hypothetical protein
VNGSQRGGDLQESGQVEIFAGTKDLLQCEVATARVTNAKCSLNEVLKEAVTRAWGIMTVHALCRPQAERIVGFMPRDNMCNSSLTGS